MHAYGSWKNDMFYQINIVMDAATFASIVLRYIYIYTYTQLIFCYVFRCIDTLPWYIQNFWEYTRSL